MYIHTGKSVSEALILQSINPNMTTDCSLIYDFSTLVYRIEVHARLLILRKIPSCTALFGSARLLILRKNSPLHVYWGRIKV